MKNISVSLSNCEQSIQTDHPSLLLGRNPVLNRLREETATVAFVKTVLAQYSLLPATIVELLTAGVSRLESLPAIKAELWRNIGEEKGSKTNNQSHYSILKNRLSCELGLDISNVTPSTETSYFLNAIKKKLASESLGYTAGIVYALEASAVPELTIVAHIINEYAMKVGTTRPINTDEMSKPLYWEKEKSECDFPYSLDFFFAAHLQVFEVGHKGELAKALQKDLDSAAELCNFEKGFEDTLSAMDIWWQHLANSCLKTVGSHSYSSAIHTLKVLDHSVIQRG